MAAGQGFKTFATGDVLTAADTNGYLMQGVWTFADAAARDAAVTSPQEGNVCYLKSTDAIMTYSGSAWVAVGGAAALVGCSATRTNVSTAITANTAFAVALTAENFDTDGFHDNATNNTRLTIPTGKGGKYLISGYVNNALGSPGSYSILKLYKGGSQLTGMGNREGDFARGNGDPILTFSEVVTLSAGEYIEMYYQQGATETVNMWFILSAIYLGA
jgi:hypothetical protein